MLNHTVLKNFISARFHCRVIVDLLDWDLAKETVLKAHQYL